ncbi:5-deoxy-glucuronate isomerase, partial [Priestia megaterium]
NKGYNVLTEMTGQQKDMLMDIGMYKMANGREKTLLDSNSERDIRLLEGKVKLGWEGHSKEIQHQTIFEEEQWCLHVSKNEKVKITGLDDSEVLIKKTDN